GGLAVLTGVQAAWRCNGPSTTAAVLSFSYLAAYGTVLFGAFAPMSPGARRGILVWVVFLVAFVVLLGTGLVGGGRLFAFGWVVVVCLFSGVRAGVAASIASVLLVGAVGLVRISSDERVLGLFRVDERYDDFEHWSTATVIYVAVLAGAMVPMLYLARHLARSLTKAERAEGEYRQLYEQSPAMHLTIDADLRIEQANETAAAILGRSPSALIGSSVVGLVPSEHHQVVAATLRALFAQPGRDLQWEMAVVRGDKSVMWVDTHGRGSAEGPDGKALHVLLVCLDLTEQRELAEQVRHSQKMEAFGQLAGGVAHDFNNLLTPIVGYSEFALDALEAGHPARSEIEHIMSAADKAAALTTKILAFSRRQPMTLRELDLNDVVRDFEELARRIIEAPIALTTNLTASRLPVRADPVALDQVLMNLCVNARDAMPGGGRIRIETARLDGATAGAGRLARLSVVDDGAGMDEETRQRVFEPFFT
ncbi:MAG: PAS domain-containing protein, partial [Myxococcota bacterium]